MNMAKPQIMMVFSSGVLTDREFGGAHMWDHVWKDK